MATLVWVLPDGSRRGGNLDQKPFITKHYLQPGESHITFVPFPLLKQYAQDVRSCHIYCETCQLKFQMLLLDT